jgi:hypothetical protein
MRNTRERAVTALSILGLAASPWLCVGAAEAASLQLFPVRSSMVPLVVATVFAAPAVVAGMLSLWGRARRSSPLVSLGLLTAAVAGAVVCARPGLLAVLNP